MLHRHHANPLPAAETRGRLIRWARQYDLSVDLLTFGNRARLRRDTVALAGIQPGETVLEVGCGTGDVALAAQALAGPAGRTCGIDPAPEMIAVAREKAARAGSPATFQLGVIEALAFPDATFDVALSSLMMHHLPDDLKRRGLAEIARVLKPGGRLVIVDVMRPTGPIGRIVTTALLHGGLNHGVQDLPELLRAAGFAAVDGGRISLPVLGYARGWMGDARS